LLRIRDQGKEDFMIKKRMKYMREIGPTIKETEKESL
jgi:hypothetical protein